MLKGIQDGWTAFTTWLNEKVEWIKSLNPFRNWRLGSAEKDALGQASKMPGASALGSQYTPPVAGSRALGGPVTAGSTYLVGERGPELFTPQQSGQILSNSQTSNALSLAPTINISVSQPGASAEEIAAAVARGLDDALMEAEAGVRALLND